MQRIMSEIDPENEQVTKQWKVNKIGEGIVIGSRVGDVEKR